MLRPTSTLVRYLLLWLACVVVAQPVVGYARMALMARATQPHCEGGGHKAMQSGSAHHDCLKCCLGAPAAPTRSHPIVVEPPVLRAAPAADFSHPSLQAAVLAPASRGPPRLS